MRTNSALFATTFALLVSGCAGFKGGWESVPYIGDSPPTIRDAKSPYESRERTRLILERITLGVTLDNQVRRYETQVYAFVVPLSVDPRTVQTRQVQAGRTRVTLHVSSVGADFVFKPSLARLTVGDKVASGLAAFQFGMWDRSGQKVSVGGEWADMPIKEPFQIKDRTGAYLLSIDFEIDSPSPESLLISLDLSKALEGAGVPPLPIIKFAPGRWSHGYT